MPISTIDRTKLSGTGVADPHAKVLLDLIDEVIVALNALVAGTLPEGGVDTAELADGAVTNDKVAADAAIAMSKLALAITNAEIAAAARIAGAKIDPDGADTTDLGTLYSQLKEALTPTLAALNLTIADNDNPANDPVKVSLIGIGNWGKLQAVTGGRHSIDGGADFLQIEAAATPAGAAIARKVGGGIVADLSQVSGGAPVRVSTVGGRVLVITHDGAGEDAIQSAAGGTGLEATLTGDAPVDVPFATDARVPPAALPTIA